VTPDRIVNSEIVAQYARDGAVCLRKCLSDHWIEVLNRGVDRNIEKPGNYFHDLSATNDSARSISDDFCWEWIPEYQEFFYSSPAGEIAGHLMDAQEVRFLEDQYFQKDAGSSAPTPWHQDQPYYTIKGRWCVMWIPLDRVARADSLLLVAGSHRWGRLFRPANFSATGSGLYGAAESRPDLEPMVDIDGQPAEYTVLSWDMDPGDCIVFHPCTIHGNRGNSSGARVRRLSLRWGAQDLYFDPTAYPWEGFRSDSGLRPGDRVSGPKFPLVWTASQGLTGAPKACRT
jgi:ectoine hydroxylase-related dioxygenase (phytanoyl-CoA dioxygenase family)